MKLVKIENADTVLEFEGGGLKDALAWVRLNQEYCTRTQLVLLVQNAVDNGSPTKVLRLVQYGWERLEEDVKSMADPLGWYAGSLEQTLPNVPRRCTNAEVSVRGDRCLWSLIAMIQSTAQQSEFTKHLLLRWLNKCYYYMNLYILYGSDELSHPTSSSSSITIRLSA